MFENLYDELKQSIRDGNYEKVKEIISIDKDLLNKVSALGSNLRMAARYNQYVNVNSHVFSKNKSLN